MQDLKIRKLDNSLINRRIKKREELIQINTQKSQPNGKNKDF